MSYLVLRLKSRLSRWSPEEGDLDGFHYTVKATADYPTERALYGMIECALGYSDEYKKEKRELEKLITFDHPIRKSDKPFKRFYDFTVGRPLKSSHKIIAACGKNKVFNKGNEPALPITQKVYLMDSDFEVHVHGPIELLEKIGHALDFPVFTYYFGNKNCIPSERVNRGIVEE